MTETMPTNLRRQAGNWITGTIGPFYVEALVFTEDSVYGMAEDGRISKLFVRMDAPNGVTLFDYDRGEYGKNHLNDYGLSEIIAAVTRTVR